MLNIAYHYRDEGNEKLASTDAENIADIDLHYNYSQGTIRLICSEIDLFLDLDNPILDFAIILQRSVARLATEGRSECEMAESDEAIIFEKFGDDVRVSHNASNWICHGDYSALKALTSDFLAEVLADLSAVAPGLMDNEYIQRTLTDDPASKWWQEA